jgi:hypothetical protein
MIISFPFVLVLPAQGLSQYRLPKLFQLLRNHGIVFRGNVHLGNHVHTPKTYHSAKDGRYGSSGRFATNQAELPVCLLYARNIITVIVSWMHPKSPPVLAQAT